MRAKLNAGHVITPDALLLSRRHIVKACRRQLKRDSHPRLHMTAMIVLTAGVAWIASSVLLALGMEAMWLRYPVALGIAYSAFLFFLWVWLRRNDLDVPDVVVDGIGHAGQPCGRGSGTFVGGGGQTGGGGASGSFGDTFGSVADCASGGGTGDWGAGDALGAGDVLGAADELAIPLIVLVAVVALALGVAFVSIYVIYTAPSLLAELTVDAALSYALVRRLKHGQRRMWLGTAIARTWWPALCTAALVAAVGALLAIWAPETTSFVAALRHLHGG